MIAAKEILCKTFHGFSHVAVSPVFGAQKIGDSDSPQILIIGAADGADYGVVCFARNRISQVFPAGIVFFFQLDGFCNPSAHPLTALTAVSKNFSQAAIRRHFDIGLFVLWPEASDD